MSNGTYDPAAGSAGYIEIAFCRISRGGSCGERARMRAATAVSLFMVSGVNRVPLLVSVEPMRPVETYSSLTLPEMNGILAN